MKTQSLAFVGMQNIFSHVTHTYQDWFESTYKDIMVTGIILKHSTFFLISFIADMNMTCSYPQCAMCIHYLKEHVDLL